MTTRGIGPRTFARIFADLDWLTAQEFLAAPPEDFEPRYKVAPGTLERVLANKDQASRVLEQLDADGVYMLVAGRRGYPSQLTGSLAEKSPPVLFAHGDADVLFEVGIGFCGSREASSRAIAAVDSAVAQLAQQHVNVIAGYAAGVDAAAHQAALASGSTTVAVLAEGILHFKLKRELRSFSDTRILALSEFAPTVTWSVGNAMTRNWTICALSDAMVVVESKMSGGTYAAGEAALVLGRPLYVVDYADAESAPGNAYFLAKGARPLRRHRDGPAETSHLWEDAVRQARRDEFRAEQEPLSFGHYFRQQAKTDVDAKRVSESPELWKK